MHRNRTDLRMKIELAFENVTGRKSSRRYYCKHIQELTRAVARRRIDRRVRAEVKVASLLALASLRNST